MPSTIDTQAMTDRLYELRREREREDRAGLSEETISHAGETELAGGGGIWNVRHSPFIGTLPRLQQGEIGTAATAAAASRGEVRTSRNYVDHAAGPAWNGQVIWADTPFGTTEPIPELRGSPQGSMQSRGCLCEDYDDSL